MGRFSKLSTTVKLEWFYLLLAILFAIYFWPKSNKKEIVIANKNSLTVTQVKEIKYSLQIDEIDAKGFIANYYASLTPSAPVADTNFASVSERLKGRVEFDSNQVLIKINFKNGKSYNLQDGDYLFFIAYFPSEDILLCEGGHTTDVSFNLNTGQETEETGNPYYIVNDLSLKRRLNAYYGGQECYSYFIQDQTDSGFKKILSVNESFNALSPLSNLCTIIDAFWLNSNALLIKADVSDKNGNPTTLHYKLTLIEK